MRRKRTPLILILIVDGFRTGTSCSQRMKFVRLPPQSSTRLPSHTGTCCPSQNVIQCSQLRLYPNCVPRLTDDISRSSLCDNFAYVIFASYLSWVSSILFPTSLAFSLSIVRAPHRRLPPPSGRLPSKDGKAGREGGIPPHPTGLVHLRLRDLPSTLPTSSPSLTSFATAFPSLGNLIHLGHISRY